MAIHGMGFQTGSCRRSSHNSSLTSSRAPGKTAVVRRFLVVLVVSAACGDNLLPPGPALAVGPNLTIVAHQDDDLLFMQPDLAAIADRHAGLTNVYVTAGNGSGGNPRKRNAGVMEAYAETAGRQSEWVCGEIELAGHPAEHCRLDGAPISLVFLGYPDGGKEGEERDSLLHLWDGSIASADTFGPSSTRYDQAGLIATVAEVIRATQPTTIRTLEVAATHGRDHSDHRLVGALALLAMAETGLAPELLAFRGYASADEPENVSDALYDRSANMLAHYHACALDCASCGAACPSVTGTHAAWLHRRYAVGFRTSVRGALRSGATPQPGGAPRSSLPIGGGCVRSEPATGALILDANCTRADEVELTADGRIQVGDRCIEVRAGGELALVTDCARVAANRFFLDDDGHLWNGGPPAPSEVTYGRHLRCVATAGDRLVVEPCGDGNAPTWSWAQHGTAIPRPSWLPSSGRAIGVFGSQLYAVVNGELLESTISALGLSAPTTRGILTVEPESLVVASLEPGTLRACGRDADGLVCGSIARGEPYTVERWTSAFARTGPVTPSDRSLSAFGSEICGLTDDGLICAPRGPTFVPAIHSRWPRPDATLWVGDLDADQRADWCAATPSGAACGRDADRILTSDGVPWSYASRGVVDPAPGAAAIGALHDIDGDGRDDLCAVEGREILCARSQAHGFGPRVPVGTLPPGGAPTGLWFHLDRACVDDGATLACVVLPRLP